MPHPRAFGITARTIVASAFVVPTLVCLQMRPAPVRADDDFASLARLRLTRALDVLAPIVAASDHRAPNYTLEERMRFYGVPGVSIAIINGGRVESALAAGLSDVGAETPVDTTTLFQAGAISMPVAALTALRVAEEGQLDLDADVNRYLGTWKLPPSRFTLTHKVTTRQILNHSAGLTVWGLPGYQPGTTLPTLTQVLNGEAPAITAPVFNDTIPGRRWLQSAGGYTVLQKLLEDVTARPFGDLATRLVLAPLGMTRSTFDNPLPPARAVETAAGHDAYGHPIAGGYRLHAATAAAGLWSTASDLAQFAVAIQRSARGDASAPLSMGLATQLLDPDTLLGLFGNHSGLGFTISGRGESERFGHEGREAGFLARLVAFRRMGKGAVVMTNGQRGDGLIQEILRALATEYEWPALRPVQVDTVATDSVAAFPVAGRYVNYVSGRDTAFVTFTWRNSALAGVLGGAGGDDSSVRSLWARPDGGFTDPFTSDTFWPLRDASGRVVALRHVNLWEESVERKLVRAR